LEHVPLERDGGTLATGHDRHVLESDGHCVFVQAAVGAVIVAVAEAAAIVVVIMNEYKRESR
jgi:hypothetical protein